jgi:hypothetical protein
MPAPAAQLSSAPSSRWPHALSVFAVLAAILAMRAEGRVWWCKCGQWYPWVSDIWSDHCSQHLLDPYTFSHICHGFWFYALLVWLPFKYKRPSFAWVLFIATLIECAWEVLENSPLVINRYRAETISIGYTGDSVINSFGDILACIAGVFIARALGPWKTLALFLIFEITMLFWVRDNLTLNVIMLIHPIEAIKHWQSVGHVLN